MKHSSHTQTDGRSPCPEVPAPWIIKVPYYVLCYFLDAVYPENRPIQRFWFLETVARMPYFSYNTMLTIYELLGWWRRSSELRRVHFAEEWNEYHHLLIHESLGGDRMWRDRPGAVYYYLYSYLYFFFSFFLFFFFLHAHTAFKTALSHLLIQTRRFFSLFF